ncbi:hypothetical protein F5887DRAFT_939003 [Amanita rubescens]|nr:hypothetical protein F5887DRAFT_939003 [Amanita rubescens]
MSAPTFFTTGVSLFAGNAVNVLLYGALTVQLYLYYISFSGDPWQLKAVVYVVYAVETAQTILLTYDMGNSFFNTFFAGASLMVTIGVPVCGGIVAFSTQAMYAYHIRTLGKLNKLLWCIVVLMVLELISLVALPPFALHFLILGWTCVSLTIAVLIAGAMVWSLRQTETLSKEAKSKVARLVYLVIGTGALTAVVNLVTVVTFAWGLAYGNVSIVYGPAIVLSKLYANSMMVFLNDRTPSGDHGRDNHATVILDSLHFATVAGPTDSAQELALEGYDGGGVESNKSARTAVEVPVKQDSCPA